MNNELKVIDDKIHCYGFKVKQTSSPICFYVFVVDGKIISRHLAVQKLEWHIKDSNPKAYQRSLNMAKVRDVVNYLNTDEPFMPNSITIALKEGSLKFNPLPKQEKGLIEIGSIEINGKIGVNKETGEKEALPYEKRIGFIVDGQHRMRAIQDSMVKEGSYPINIVAFDGVDTKFQLNQFYFLNQTVPISRGHINVLRAELNIITYGKEGERIIIDQIAKMLREDFHDSPFKTGVYVKIPKVTGGKIKNTVVSKMIGSYAIKTDKLRTKWKPDPRDMSEQDKKYVARYLYIFWQAIREMFKDDWEDLGKKGLTSATSIYALTSYIMPGVMADIDIKDANAVGKVIQKLDSIKDLNWDNLDIGILTRGMTREVNGLGLALTGLYEANGKRPHKFVVKVGAEEVINLEMT